MPVNLSGRRIFIASPGGLEAERTALRERVDQFNKLFAFEKNVVFFLRGWEDVLGTVLRPQAAINPLLETCDFMVLLLSERWGSPPGGDSGFESGTEEEFHEAARLLRLPEAPLRNLLTIFKAVDPARLSEPDPQLRKVLEFRAELEQKKELLFNVVDTTADLLLRFDAALHEWAKPLAPKEARLITVRSTPPATLVAVESAHLDAATLIARAEQLAEDGLLTQAEMVFSRAIETENPLSLLRFARFLRRRGRVDRAVEANTRAVRSLALSDATGDRVLLAEALANLGILNRQQGRMDQSIRHLQEACETARSAGADGTKALGYALDNLGWSHSRVGDPAAARDAFEEARLLRQSSGDVSGAAVSGINAARMRLLENDFTQAVALAEDALSVLDERGDPANFANALAAHGEALVGLGRTADGVLVLERALVINERLGNTVGIGVASSALCRAALAENDLAAAAKHADRIRLESERSLNRESQVVAAQLLGEVDAKQGRWSTAIPSFERATTLAKEMRNPIRELIALNSLAIAFSGAGRTPEAEGARQHAADLSRKLKGNPSRS